MKPFSILAMTLVLFCATVSLLGQQKSMVWVETPLKNEAIISLAATNSALFACRSNALYQSNNNAGTAWISSGSGISSGISGDTGIGMLRGVYAGSDPAIFAVMLPLQTPRGSRGGGVFRSLDSGKTWYNAGIGSLSLQIAKTNSAIFINNLFYGVGRSLDNGTTWSWTPDSVFASTVLGVCSNNRQAFVCTSNAIFSSLDNGDSWQKITSDISSHPENTSPAPIGISVVTDSVIFVALQHGIGVFQFNARNPSIWWKISLSDEVILSLAKKNDTVFCGTRNGVFYSANGGISWGSVNTGLSEKTVIGQSSRYVSSLAVDNQGYLYAAASNGSVYRLSYLVQPTSARDLTLPSPITLSPNPAQESITLALPENELHRVRVMNTLGSQVSALSDAAGATALDMSGLAAGVYFVEVESQKTRRRTVQKVVKY